MSKATLLQGDCMELMSRIPDGSIDMVLSDLPYGTTRCRWDTPINLQELWKQYRRVVKENGAIVLFSAQPFTTELISSNKAMYRYEWIWKKTIHTTPRTGIRWMCCNTAPGTRPSAYTRHRSPWTCWNTWSRPTRTQERQSWTTAWELEAPALPA